MNFDLKKVLFILLVLIVLGLLISNYKIFLKVIYPLVYKDLIFREAANKGLDPYLVAAVIYAESKFDPHATSNTGAKGLMQIMPKTGKWIAKMKSDNDFSVSDLYTVKKNIEYGCWYLAWLYKRFDRKLAVTLAAYNGGLGNVDKWLENDRWDGKHKNADQIPFTQTKNYVNRVMKFYDRYKFIYKEEGEDSFF
ncbi:soluble lytic murein transglycosylase-like protein [Halobacteroides halobius DSM 5150]|uniref:Soluble lytic murein transglycosylase-like protein n=1 Tax=Halobacteroides halobius (strain ATCC 35273 / DSM 5150 / MD-1) TaxID=748449 RepID=L0K8H9_HALHC|nr:lytic transglycosylase domain-containing protein [Halobacteroides halobius]AGB40428.1 soluble lytic murein transglycosylase-like protein [Halobacteroides halobius DSM 5150]